MTEIGRKDTLKDSKFTLFQFFTLVSIENLFEIALLAFVHTLVVWLSIGCIVDAVKVHVSRHYFAKLRVLIFITLI